MAGTIWLMFVRSGVGLDMGERGVMLFVLRLLDA